MPSPRRRPRRTIDIWPGFVDALSTLLIIFMFVLMVFVLAQFFLGQALTGSNETVNRLGRELRELGEALSMERKASSDLRLDVSRLSAELETAAAAGAERDELAARLRAIAEAARESGLDENDLSKLFGDIKADRETLRVQLDELAALRNDVQALKALKAEMEARLGERDAGLASERELSKQARAQAALLNQQLDAVRAELARLNVALTASEALSVEQKAQISALGERLNKALAGKVEELTRYRSEFFGRLREVLGKDSGVRIEGDRFVFQSEVLFETGSSVLGAEGQKQLARLAAGLVDLGRKIPKGINWVLRVDGHTDKQRISNDRYASNWELSTARALSVVHALIDQGVPAERLAAAGFGEYQPE
ncbi:MAG: peptidoglycan -binding protein, partial [Alphaproteobacteria bacterium]|nr:peptidoglycan -binding protein [Alphaproteobacteria bacterium]